jgi:hypothetical protein
MSFGGIQRGLVPKALARAGWRVVFRKAGTEDRNPTDDHDNRAANQSREEHDLDRAHAPQHQFVGHRDDRSGQFQGDAAFRRPSGKGKQAEASGRVLLFSRGHTGDGASSGLPFSPPFSNLARV